MDEQPKSIWKKPWKGWRGALLWFALLAAAAFVVIFCIGLIAGADRDLVIGALVSSVCIATLTVLSILFSRWICCWRNFRRFLFSVACVVTVIALFYAEENWRGKHAWKKFKTEWEAKGERFDFASIIPPPVPDDQNFAMQTIWVEEISGMMGMEKATAWYGNRVAALGHTNRVRSLEMPVEFGGRLENTNYSKANWQKAGQIDLKLWQEYYRWLATVTNIFPASSKSLSPSDTILFALSKYDSTIEKLRDASKLPYARFPLGYTDDDPAGILLPHLASLKGCALTLRLRAVAELQADQTEKALDDIRLMLRLTDSIRTEPFLISHLVRIAMLPIAIQPIWEGLADHKWTDAQLATLDTELGKLDFLADYQSSIRGERAGDVGIIDFFRRNRNQIAGLIDMTGWSFDDDDKRSHSNNKDFQTIIFQFAPSGWFDQNKIAVCKIHEEYFLPVINLQTRLFSSVLETNVVEALQKLSAKRNPYNWFARLLLPSLMNASKKFVQAQAAVDMARIACALERYRLAHGNFPETLDALAPQFMEKIPHDIIGGKPLKYRRTDPPSPGSSGAASQFILYSVGWNETDDGGKVGLTEKGNVDWKQGDWVWQYPAK